MKSKNLLIAVSLFSGVVLAGCYTVIEHPDVTTKDENGYAQNNEVMFYDDCSSCHKNGDEHSYTAVDETEAESSPRPYNTYNDGYYYDRGSYYYDDYGYSGTDMGYFYNIPWWYQFRPQQDASTVERGAKSSNGNTSSSVRNNGGGRGEPQTRQGRMSDERPTVVVPTGSSGSTSSGSARSTSSNNNSSDNKSSDTRTRNDNGSNERKSSDGSRTRDNGGGRSSGGSGRR